MVNKNERSPHYPQGDNRTTQNRTPEINNLDDNALLGVDPVDNIHGVNDPAVVPEVPQEVINEKNDRPAANTIKWAVIIAIILMIIVYFMVFYDRDVISSAP